MFNGRIGGIAHARRLIHNVYEREGLVHFLLAYKTRTQQEILALATITRLVQRCFALQERARCQKVLHELAREIAEQTREKSLVQVRIGEIIVRGRIALTLHDIKVVEHGRGRGSGCGRGARLEFFVFFTAFQFIAVFHRIGGRGRGRG